MEFQESMNARWRMQLFQICVLLAAIGTITEIGIYLYDASHRALFLPHLIYRFRFIYIPSTLNLAVILVTYGCLKSKKFSDTTKNMWACLLIYFLCANTQVIHYVYGPLLALPSIAIFVTVLFSNKKLTLGILLLSYLSLALAVRQASVELRKGDPQLLSDAFLAALVMFVTYISARLLINYVAEQMNYILTSNMRQKQLIEECNLDPLMGIGNRRSLEKRLEKLGKQTYQGNRPLLLMLDLDDFKEVNDTYGHICGDEVLLALSEKIREVLQENRIEAFRYGGEEIILLFYDTEKQEALRIANELLNKFSNITFSFENKKRITFSAGLAAFEEGMHAEEWVEQADYKLYNAKKNGKNSVMA